MARCWCCLTVAVRDGGRCKKRPSPYGVNATAQPSRQAPNAGRPVAMTPLAFACCGHRLGSRGHPVSSGGNERIHSENWASGLRPQTMVNPSLALGYCELLQAERECAGGSKLARVLESSCRCRCCGLRKSPKAVTQTAELKTAEMWQPEF